MTVVMDDVVARETRHVLQTYKRNAVTLVRGEGVRLFDANGREYYDLLSGIGVAALGHAHPGLARAVADQANTLIHTSNLFFHPLQGQLAERLADLLLAQRRHVGLPPRMDATAIYAPSPFGKGSDKGAGSKWTRDSG